MEPLPLLLRAAPFQDVTAAELEPLLPSFRRHDCERGARLWRQGDPATDMWFVVAGSVHTVHASEMGDEVVTAVVGPGDSTGQVGLFLPVPIRQTTCIAAEASTLLSLHHDALLGFLERHPAALRRMLESLAVLTAGQTMLFRELAFNDVRARVARQILELADSHGEAVTDGVRITLALRQGVLAGLVAASRENVNRALSALSAAGAIRLADGHIVVIERAVLRAACAAAGRI